MKILFLTADGADYLADSLLHGLRNLVGSDVVDYPKCEIMYSTYMPPSFQEEKKYHLYGLGFTLYKLLPNVDVDRLQIRQKIMDGYFDLMIFASIHSQFGLLLELLPHLNSKNTIILDGADTPQPYPYAGKWWRYPNWWFLPRAHTRFLYFKREWTPETIRNMWFQIPPICLSQYLPSPKNLRKIAFSIPAEKIVKELPTKTKLFPRHIVDVEVADRIPNSLTRYAFNNEQEYYADLQASKFGITTKRSGWDCLRHYEIAANACVPCFRNLEKKPFTCAPHGLDEGNCITYRNYDDLMDKVNLLSDEEYSQLQIGALTWARKNTTVHRAKELLEFFHK
jgi:hypothetical protein